MKWLSILALVLTRFFQQLDRDRAQAKRIRQEDRRNGIKKNPDHYHRKLFGRDAGRVSIDTDPDKSNQ
ncbi:TPA: hypothetical protein ACX6RA_003552 [Photobacterium damselae]